MQRLNSQTFEEWKNHPLTQAYLAFLRDQSQQLADQWSAGQEMDLRHQTKAMLCKELSSLEWSDYATFYSIPVAETEA